MAAKLQKKNDICKYFQKKSGKTGKIVTYYTKMKENARKICIFRFFFVTLHVFAYMRILRMLVSYGLSLSQYHQ